MFNWLKNRSKPQGFYFNAVDISGNAGEMIKIVPLGNFLNHPDGAHEITMRHIEEMARNFANTKKDLLVDYEHRSLFGNSKAAGWSPKVEVRSDGLYWQYPDFTKPAMELIANREYRYFSPAYVLNAKDKLGRNIGAMLDHVGLTNTPYMDNEIDHVRNSKTEIAQMDKNFLDKLGLKEDATEEQVLERIDTLQKAATPPTPPAEAPKENSATPVIPEAVEKRLAALEAGSKLAQTQAAETLINSAINDGKLLPAHKDIWLNAAINDFAGTKGKLDAMQKNVAMPSKAETPAKDGKPVKKNSVGDVAAYLKGFNRQPQPKT